MRAADYAKTAADNLLIIGQIESATAVKNAAEIAAVDGIDVLFIGPTDLSGSVHKLMAFDDAKVIGLIAEAERSIKQSGKKLGGIVMAGEKIAEKFERGYDFWSPAGDVTFLRDGAKALRAARGARVAGASPRRARPEASTPGSRHRTARGC